MRMQISTGARLICIAHTSKPAPENSAFFQTDPAYITQLRREEWKNRSHVFYSWIPTTMAAAENDGIPPLFSGKSGTGPFIYGWRLILRVVKLESRWFVPRNTIWTRVGMCLQHAVRWNWRCFLVKTRHAGLTNTLTGRTKMVFQVT